MRIEVSVEGIDKEKAALDDLRRKVYDACREFVTEGCHEIERLAKANATGRPGPNVRSGALRSSIFPDPAVPEGFGWKCSVGPHSVYGRSVEMGMFRPPHGYKPGVSARAIARRHPGFGGEYPYLRPARDAAVPLLERLWESKMAEAIG